MLRFILPFAFLLSVFAKAQTVQSMSFAQLQKRLLETKDSVVILNFWATWCKPCIEELPYFEQLNEKYASRKVKVILVNLDFNSKIKTAVEPFVKNRKLKSEVIHVTDTDPDTWIAKISNSWSGAIPATVMYDSSHQEIKFTEGQMTYQELESALQPYIQ